jgi:predicted kinase
LSLVAFSDLLVASILIELGANVSLDALHRFLQRERVVKHAADGHVRALAARAHAQATAAGMERRCDAVCACADVLLRFAAAAAGKPPPPLVARTPDELAAATHSALVLAHRSIPGIALTTRERLSIVLLVNADPLPTCFG